MSLVYLLNTIEVKMKPSKLPKDKTTCVRYNSEVMEKLKKKGYKSIQDLVNKTIDQKVKISVK